MDRLKPKMPNTIYMFTCTGPTAAGIHVYATCMLAYMLTQVIYRECKKLSFDILAQRRMC